MARTEENEKKVQLTSKSESESKSKSKSDQQEVVTILGFGSLLSEQSSRMTFPTLTNFRLGRVYNYRRVFGHPASIFFQRGIANMKTKEMSSLCAEYCEGYSFVCSVFEVSNQNGEFMDVSGNSNNVGNDDDDDVAERGSFGSSNEFVPSMAFREREEEFEIIMVPYEEIQSSSPSSTSKIEVNVDINNTDTGIEQDCFDEDSNHSFDNKTSLGILCTKSTDENYIKLWGKERFRRNYGMYNIDTIWNWQLDSGLRPCAPYLRHCALAAKKMGEECYNSFLDETYLVDRKTTIRQYLMEHSYVMEILPPPELAERYGG